MPSSIAGEAVVERAPEGIQALTEALSRALSTTDIANAVSRYLPVVAGAASGTLALRSESGATLELIGGGDASETATAHLALDAAAAYVVQTGQPLWIETLARAADTLQDLPERAAGHQSLAVLPILQDKQVGGALILAFDEERSFQLEERMLLFAVAGQCAVALQRASAFAGERASRERLEVALRAANMGTWDWDLRKNEVAWSPELEQIHGLEPGGLGMGLDRYFEHLHPEDRERIRGEIGTALETGELHLTYRGVWPNGEVHWYEAVGTLTRDADGQGVALRGVCRDVTLRTRAEQNLRESEERFRTLADNSAQFAWMADSTGARFWYNQRWYDFTGTTLEQMEGWGWTKVHHPDHVERVVQGTKRAWESHTPWEDTFPLRGQDGLYRWFLARAVPIRDQHGQIVRWLGTDTDITERRWTEALVVGERDALASMARGSPIEEVLSGLCHTVEQLAADPGMFASILLMDADGLHLRHGAAPTLPEAYNRAIDGGAIGPRVASCGTAAFRGEQVVVSDIATSPLWSDYRDLALSHGLRACWSTPIRGLDAQVLGTFGVYYNRPRAPTPEHLKLASLVGRTAAVIIERKRAEDLRARLADERDRLLAAEHAAREQAEAAVRARDDFVTVVSHDLRNPLAAINWHLQMMRRRAARGDVPSAEQLVERLDLIEASITALSAQIEELQDATRLQAGHPLQLQLRPTDLVALARDSARAVQYTSDTHQVRFEAALPELVGNWDRDRLERVLANLLSNAIKYSPSGGDVLVQVKRARNDAMVSVIDWGLGIPEVDLPHVFERFRRASNVGGKIAGSGLGLAGARDIVELHGGTIVVRSEEGRGSTFEVRLPLETSD
ncbi:MAG TPA: PAS domain-containing protein [Chloroflexota bacterium]